ncbi:MAG: cyclase family protein [Pyrinomonadaceae bacterium]|nr:cyclase family protein [Pyrinomonadaceae bacterium]
MSDTNFNFVSDLSIPLRFGGDQPNVYGVDAARSMPCEYGDFVGDTRLGGSVNFEEYSFIPHCNGTHTECVGHITEERISVRDCLNDVFMEASLVSVEPENAIDSGERYPFDLAASDQFVTRASLERALGSISDNASSLIIRTLPNDDSKLTRDYDKPVPPFLSNDAARYIVDCGFDHLLVDLPSIDRLYDDGKLSNHRIFWDIDLGSKALKPESRVDATVTELIYVPNNVEDGVYKLNLQIAPFDTDAAPSRPLILR